MGRIEDENILKEIVSWKKDHLYQNWYNINGEEGGSTIWTEESFVKPKEEEEAKEKKEESDIKVI